MLEERQEPDTGGPAAKPAEGAGGSDKAGRPRSATRTPEPTPYAPYTTMSLRFRYRSL